MNNEEKWREEVKELYWKTVGLSEDYTRGA